MEIAGFVKNSLIDYPKHIACVVFTPGCNMNCGYCHNKHLKSESGKIAEEEVFDYLRRNKGFIEGVVVSGGEPTLQKGLFEFVRAVKDLGFKVKLDTNGTKFETVKKLMDEDMLDFVAMDIKAPFKKYKEVSGTDDDMESVIAIKDLLLSGVVDYEFRTTFAKELSEEDIVEIAKSISGAKTFALQKFRPNLKGERGHDDCEQTKAVESVRQYVGEVISRGL